MNILLLGSGGREHALAWKLAQSPLCERLFAAPGNPGIAEHAALVPLDARDHAAVAAFCASERIGLVVIGPEAPLVDGLADTLRGAGVPVFGPSKAAAQLEGSKAFTKELCARHHIPTGAFKRVTTAAQGLAALDLFTIPVVKTEWEPFHAWLRSGPGQLVGLSLDTDTDYRAARYAGPTFLLTGNEAQGMPPEMAAACDVLVKIPMLGKADSLNAAVATAVMAYEVLARQGNSETLA